MDRVERSCIWKYSEKEGHGDAVFQRICGLRMYMHEQSGIHDMHLIVENLFSEST